jgi:hypothetical protein
LRYDRFKGKDQHQQLLVVAAPGEVRPPLTPCHRDKAVEDLEDSTAFLFGTDRKKRP